jgi:hypothetical protein
MPLVETTLHETHIFGAWPERRAKQIPVLRMLVELMLHRERCGRYQSFSLLNLNL